MRRFQTRTGTRTNTSSSPAGTPNIKPAERIELSERHFSPRLILSILFLVLAAGLIAYSLVSLLSQEPGWREIEVSSSAEQNCGGEFVFQYKLGGRDVSATAEYKQLSALYTEAAVTAYRLFHPTEEFAGGGLHNVAYLNHHINETVEVDSTLYAAFSLLEAQGSRLLYLAPVYAEYSNLFFCANDDEAAQYDPFTNPETVAYFSELLAFAGDPDAVELKLLGDNRVMLAVSDTYRKYAEETGFSAYLDFFWLKNAFILDYIADVMLQNGYTAGAISSFDGFVRNLDDSGELYSFNLFDRVGQTVYPAAQMQYRGGMSIVYLRDYPMNELDVRHYYRFQSGAVRTSYIDPGDGLCKNAIPQLVVYSRRAGCAELALRLSPIYIADAFEPAALAALREQQIESVYCLDRVIYPSDTALTLDLLYDKEGVRYTVGK